VRNQTAQVTVDMTLKTAGEFYLAETDFPWCYD